MAPGPGRRWHLYFLHHSYPGRQLRNKGHDQRKAAPQLAEIRLLPSTVCRRDSDPAVEVRYASVRLTRCCTPRYGLSTRRSPSGGGGPDGAAASMSMWYPAGNSLVHRAAGQPGETVVNLEDPRANPGDAELRQAGGVHGNVRFSSSPLFEQINSASQTVRDALRPDFPYQPWFLRN
jgi:hypothetical protein